MLNLFRSAFALTLVLAFGLCLSAQAADPKTPRPSVDSDNGYVNGPDGTIGPEDERGSEGGMIDDPVSSDDDYNEALFNEAVEGRNETLVESNGFANQAAGPKTPRPDVDSDNGYVNGPDGTIGPEDERASEGGMIEDPVTSDDDYNEALFSEALGARENVAGVWNSMSEEEREQAMNSVAAAVVTTGAIAGGWYASPYLKKLMSQRMAVASGRLTMSAVASWAPRALGYAGAILFGVEMMTSPANARETLDYWLTQEGMNEWLNTDQDSAALYMQINPEIGSFVVELNNQI